MKNSVIISLFLLALVFFMPVKIMAADTIDVGTNTVSKATDTIDVGIDTVSKASFTEKVNRMSAALYEGAAGIMAPLVIGILVIGGILAIFFKAARLIVVWSIGGLILVLWAPMIVQTVITWVN